MTAGELIKKLRIEQDVTQEQLADAIGVSRQIISQWETDEGEPRTNSIFAMCDFFRVPVRLFMDVEGLKNKEELYQFIINSASDSKDVKPKNSKGLKIFLISVMAFTGLVLLGFFGVVAISLYLALTQPDGGFGYGTSTFIALGFVGLCAICFVISAITLRKVSKKTKFDK